MVDEKQKNTIITISAVDDAFPHCLKIIPQPPKELYAIGDLSLTNTPCIAIVGSRTPSAYGIQAATMFARTLAQHGITIVSGLARGIDSAAHKACLDAGGKTIAVLGGGIKQVYPKENIPLARRIAKEGLIVSEYSPEMPPAAHHFLVRNRIISGLSIGVLIVEAGERSGTLNTASHALAQGKDIFILPGSIFSAKSIGTNNLIKEIQGAMVTDPADIIAALGVKPQTTPRSIDYTFEEQQVLSLIGETGEAHFDAIVEKLGDTTQALVLLSTMELKSLITKIDGNFFIENK